MRFSRAYQYTKEFRERQGAFDFAALGFAIIEIALGTKRMMADVLKNFRKKLWWPAIRKPHQLVLELDSIAQIPMFQPVRS